MYFYPNLSCVLEVIVVVDNYIPPSLPYSYALEAAGAPVLEGEVLGEVLSGSSVPLVCSSPGSQDTTTLR